MNESFRLAAWLDAHAKFMKHQEEQNEMRRAARTLRSLENEILSNLEALQSAHKTLKEIKGFALELSKQKVT